MALRESCFANTIALFVHFASAWDVRSVGPMVFATPCSTSAWPADTKATPREKLVVDLVISRTADAMRRCPRPNGKSLGTSAAPKESAKTAAKHTTPMPPTQIAGLPFVTPLALRRLIRLGPKRQPARSPGLATIVHAAQTTPRGPGRATRLAIHTHHLLVAEVISAHAARQEGTIGTRQRHYMSPNVNQLAGWEGPPAPAPCFFFFGNFR